MQTLVMKFGGTSMGDAAAIAQVAMITVAERAAGNRTAVVVSAMSGVTDTLLRAARANDRNPTSTDAAVQTLRARHHAVLAEIAPAEAAQVGTQIDALLDEFALLCRSIAVLGEASPRALDAVAGMGERLSARVGAAALRAHGLDAVAIDASELIVTTGEFGNAVPIYPATRETIRARLLPLLAAGTVPIITGFIGATAQGAITTLGRGGSDFSAAIIGAALDAAEVAIYTDVDGVLTTDPRLVPEARLISTLSYGEMAELAYFGAKVLHPRTVRPVVERGIPLRIRNTFNPQHTGTLVVAAVAPGARAVRAVTRISRMSLVTVEGRGMIGVPGVAARTFGAVAAVGANVLMISQASSEQSICFVVPSDAAEVVVSALEEGLQREIARRDIDRIWSREEVVIVTAVGAGMRETPGVAAQVFTALAAAKINIVAISQGSSECAISAVVAASDADAAVRALHALT